MVLWSELKRIVSSVGDHHISRNQQRRLAALEPVRPAEPALKLGAGKNAETKDTASTVSNPWTRTPTPTQLARRHGLWSCPFALEPEPRKDNGVDKTDIVAGADGRVAQGLDEKALAGTSQSHQLNGFALVQKLP